MSKKVYKIQARFAEEDAASEANALKALLGVKEGRRFLSLLLSRLGALEPPSVGNALETARACGKHEEGLRLLQLLIQLDPGNFIALTQETNHVDETRRKEAAEASRRGDDTRSFYGTRDPAYDSDV